MNSESFYEMNERTTRRKVRRFATGLGGGVVVVVGIIAIPYPGPGWLIVFAGLAILAREFPWAARVLKFTKGKYDDWNSWIRRQHWSVRAALFIVTALVVVATLWLINAYGLLNDWFHLGQDRLHSPLL
jgi:uncharacterized protein (TIGR02611 family)